MKAEDGFFKIKDMIEMLESIDLSKNIETEKDKLYIDKLQSGVKFDLYLIKMMLESQMEIDRGLKDKVSEEDMNFFDAVEFYENDDLSEEDDDYYSEEDFEYLDLNRDETDY
jgi:hypothetical protein